MAHNRARDRLTVAFKSTSYITSDICTQYSTCQLAGIIYRKIARLLLLSGTFLRYHTLDTVNHLTGRRLLYVTYSSMSADTSSHIEASFNGTKEASKINPSLKNEEPQTPLVMQIVVRRDLLNVGHFIHLSVISTRFETYLV